MAERDAWKLSKEKGLDLVVVNPVMVVGPLLQPSVNPSLYHIIKLVSGTAKNYPNTVLAYVHVIDVATAHILAYETPSASGQRYLCAQSVLHRGDVAHTLAKFFPDSNVPTKYVYNLYLLPCYNY